MKIRVCLQLIVLFLFVGLKDVSFQQKLYLFRSVMSLVQFHYCCYDNQNKDGAHREEIRNFSINSNYVHEETEAWIGSMTGSPAWLPGPTLFP